MSKKIILLAMSLLMALSIVACGTETTNKNAEDSTIEEIVVNHELGDTTVKKNPEKVVVFDFGVLDSLDKMGIEVAGVPQTNIPPYLSKYEDSKYENVGSLKELDFEKISQMKPDLIVISGRQSGSYEELSKIAPTIYMALDYENYLDSFTSNMRLLGEIFDKEEYIEKELEDITESIMALKQKALEIGNNALILLANEGSISAYGAGSRFGIIHDEFGYKPVDETIDVSTHGMSVSFEYIQEKNPHYIFVIDRTSAVGGEISAVETIENELVKNTKAYKDGNIVYLDPNYWYLSGGGLVSVPEMVKAIDTVTK